MTIVFRIQNEIPIAFRQKNGPDADHFMVMGRIVLQTGLFPEEGEIRLGKGFLKNDPRFIPVAEFPGKLQDFAADFLIGIGRKPFQLFKSIILMV